MKKYMNHILLCVFIVFSSVNVFAKDTQTHVYQGKVTSVEWDFFSQDGDRYFDVTICLHNENTNQDTCATAFGYETGYMWKLSKELIQIAIVENKTLKITTETRSYWFNPDREIITKISILN